MGFDANVALFHALSVARGHCAALAAPSQPGCPRRGRRATWVIMGLPKVCVVEGGVVKSGLKRIEREREREIKT